MPTITTNPAGGSSPTAPPPDVASIAYDRPSSYLDLATHLDDDLVVDWSDPGPCQLRLNFLVPSADQYPPFVEGYTRTVGLTIARTMYQDWPIVRHKSSELPPPTYLDMGGITLTDGDKTALQEMYFASIRDLPLRVRQQFGPDFPLEAEFRFDYWGYASLDGGTPVHRQFSESRYFTIRDFLNTIIRTF